MLNLEEQINKQLQKANNILIVFNSDWEGDAIASSLALFLFLKKINKNVDIAAAKNSFIASEKNDKHLWQFLPSFQSITHTLVNLRKFIVSLNIKQASISQIKYSVEGEKLNFIIAPEKGWFKPEDVSSHSSGFKYDLIFCVDSPDLESLGSIYDNNVEFFHKTPIINIDHQADNEEYGQINYLDLNLASSAEMIYRIINNHNSEMMNEDIATCLLAGIIAKTKNYKVPNLTPRTLLTSSKLISAGARREEIVQNIYRSRSLESLKAWGQILSNLNNSSEYKLIWSTIELQDSQSLDDEIFHFDELAEEIFSSSPQAQIFILLAKCKNNKEGEILAYANKGYSAHHLLTEWRIIYKKQQKVLADNVTINDNWPHDLLESIKKRLDKNVR